VVSTFGMEASFLKHQFSSVSHLQYGGNEEWYDTGSEFWCTVLQSSYHVTEENGVALTFKLLFCRNLVKFLSRTLAFLTEAFHDFLQSLQADANVVALIRP
jgi:hypothetical protein